MLEMFLELMTKTPLLLASIKVCQAQALAASWRYLVLDQRLLEPSSALNLLSLLILKSRI